MAVNNIYFTLVFALGLALSVTAFSISLSHKSHDYVFGVRAPGDRPLLIKTVKVDKNLFTPRHHKETFASLDGRAKITQIVADDQGSGAHVETVSGGVGYPNVTLRFISHIHAKIDFIVTLYGH